MMHTMFGENARWAWFFLWITLIFFHEPKNSFRGYFGRAYRKMPVARTMFERFAPFTFVAWVFPWWTIMGGLATAHLIPVASIYAIDCARLLDDWINHDDKPWKKLKQVGNKIKWKMELPKLTPARETA